jgi:hypothetical protein
MQITLTNDYHNTTTTVRTEAGFLAAGQVQRAADNLCGITGCTCGDVAGCRPQQVEECGDGSARISSGPPATMQLRCAVDCRVSGWGSDWGARRVTFPGNRDMRQHVLDALETGTVTVTDCPEHQGTTNRVLVVRGNRIYTRMPSA